MGQIHVLSFELANLIAAGEVVERPSSVLKELIENSIDAGATHIVAEIKRGGVALIRVTDDGCGMEKEDLPVSLKRHATSKIRGKEDLASIMTLGFRGEALAAISAVSAVTIITKTKTAPTAAMLTSEGGNIIELCEVDAADGTTVVVENLFYNVPARRKFLKKDATEAMNVTALVEKVALSHPEISIQLQIDGEEKFRTPGDGELLHTIRSIYGREFASKLLAVDNRADGVRVYGFIGRSDNVRKNRNMENVFINGRYVKSKTVCAALEKAYTSYIAPECFPACILLLEMSPSAVDVNVHPAKLEVKFSDERIIFEAVYHTVRAALEAGSYRPELSADKRRARADQLLGAFAPIGEKNTAEQLRIPSVPEKKHADLPPYVRETSGPRQQKSPASPPAPAPTMTPGESVDILEKYRRTAPDAPGVAQPRAAFRPSSEELFSSTPAVPVPAEPTEARPPVFSSEALGAVDTEAAAESVEYRIVGEAFRCYLIVEVGEELLVMDKHAAHERILFEDLKASRKKDGRVASQGVLFPLEVDLTEEECAAVMEYKEDFKAVGFDFYVESHKAYLSAVPALLGPTEAGGLFSKMAGEAAEGWGNPTLTEELRRERALYQLACKAAIKGGRSYDDATVIWLVEKVLAMQNLTVCPHGRPIAYRLSKHELDRRFDRIK